MPSDPLGTVAGMTEIAALPGTAAAGPAHTDTDTDDDGQLVAFEVPDELEPGSPPLIDDLGRVRLSFSRIDTYRRCPRQFRYSYVDRLPSEPAPHLSFGTSIHRALETFYDRKLPRCPTEQELLGFLYDAWDRTGFGELDRDEQLAYYRHAQQVLRRFHAREAPRYRLPAATEAWFELPVGDTALVVGSIDRVDVDDDGVLTVIDYKTSRKVRDRAAVARSLQLSIYALACEHLYGALPGAVALDFVVAGITVEVPVADLDLEAARRAVLETAEAVRAEAYEPAPNNLCGWCDHRAVCPAWLGEGPEVLGPATQELTALRRSLRRDVRRLRELEAGVARLRDEVDGAADAPDGDRTVAP
jgi:putative RecB family exonuclease